jgi:hypothetical protein
MKLLKRLILLTLLSAAPVFVMAAPPKPVANGGAAAGVFGTLKAIYEGVDRATERRDIAALNRMLDARFLPTFTATDGKQRFGLKEIKQQLAAFVGQATNIRSSTIIEKVTVQDNKAVVIARSALSGRVMEAGAPLSSLYKAEGRQEDTWVRSAAGGGWKLSRSRILTMRETRNGKPLGKPAP